MEKAKGRNRKQQKGLGQSWVKKEGKEASNLLVGGKLDALSG